MSNILKLIRASNLWFLFLLPSVVNSQQEMSFNYLKDRLGKLDLSIFIETSRAKKEIGIQDQIEWIAGEEDVVLIFELTNLRLGYERESRLLKKPRDKENFFIEIPQNPENITLSSKGVKLISISNEGRLADRKSDKVNKRVEIKYALQNTSPQALQQDIYIRFFVTAFEGKVQLRPSDRGGTTIQRTVVLQPNPEIVQKQKALEVYNQILDTTLSMEDRLNYFTVFMDHFGTVDQDLTSDLIQWKSERLGNDPSDDPETILFSRISRAYNLGNYSLTFDFCRQYDERMITEPEIITGRYLPDVLYYGILSSADNQNKKRNEWLNRIRQQFPTYSKLGDLPKRITSSNRSFSATTEYDATTMQRDELMDQSVDTIFSMDSLNLLSEVEELEPLDFSAFIEEDEGSIFIHDNGHELTFRTPGISSIYIVNFNEQKTKKLIANPSFKGEERSMDLHDLKLPNGEYIISLMNRNGLKLDEQIISFRSRRLSAELKYILGLSSLLLLFGAYRKYFAL